MTRSVRSRSLVLVLCMVLAVAGGACSEEDSVTSDDGASSEDESGTEAAAAKEGEPIRLAAQDFAESKTLTEVYGQYLEAKGYEVDIQPASGFREIVYPALEGGDLDLIIDYTGSAATYLDPEGEASADPDETFTRLEEALAAKELVAFDYSPAEDRNAMVMLEEFATENDITTISDIAAVQDQVVLGGSAQCAERQDCLLGYQDPAVYGLEFKDFKTLEYGPPLTAALEAGEIQAAQYQTTAPAIASGKFVVLTDDKGLLSADNIVPLLRSEVAEAYGDDLRSDVDELSEQLTTEDLIEWNVATDIDKEEPADVAEAWLEESDLL